ncbi:MAG TPA: peptide deformylase [Candidatus Paceibacterota bacterium]|nr:peptide deformylase [Candidatus Paceibacterota bacterium]
MVTIIQSGDNVLRKISKEVPVASITKPKIQKIIADMSEALDSQFDGVAIAAPQIGVSLRIFVVSGKVFDEDFINGKNLEKNYSSEKKREPNMVFINPVFKKTSQDKKLMMEGCLSVRPLYGKVRRATRATVVAYNEKGVKFTKEASGLLAHIFQHEMDHLEGILFIDKAKDVREVFLD